jgi:TolB-like protein/class 3 adenylate cyclase/Tfp pilus assembly protein PilF
MPAETKKEIGLEIAHVLFIDIVGYSKLLIDEQRDYLHTLNEVVRETESFRAAEAAGKLTRLPTGDGMALVFATTPDAPVSCALQVSKALRSHPEVQVRMGIHSGPVSGITDVNDRSNVAGAGINLAQRVMDCGDAGHILLSKHVADDLEQYRQWRSHLHDLGECEVKHDVRVHVVNLYTDELGNREVPEKFRKVTEQQPMAPLPVAVGDSKPKRNRLGLVIAMALVVSALLAVAVIFLRRPVTSTVSAPAPPAVPTPAATAPAIPEKSIAVLPFENLSEEKANAFFADGVQDEILTNLAKIADLKVISRTSVMQYKTGTARNLREIGQQLGVAHLLEGSVQRASGKVRVNAQLIDARNDAHLWAQTYDRDLADVFAIQSEIAKTIADQLQAKLSPSEKAAIDKPPTTDLTANDLYLRAQVLWADTTDAVHAKEKLPQATRLLDEAASRDPKFLLAWCLLARVHTYMHFGGYDHTPARLELANAAVQSALRLQPDAGEAHLALADYYYRGFRDYERARAELAIARRTLPNNAEVFEYSGYIDRREGHWEEATRNLERALELDPRNFYTIQQLAATYQQQRRYADAARIYDRALTIVPGDPSTRMQRAQVAFDERADIKSYQTMLATLIAEDPGFAPDAEDPDHSLCERTAAAAARALTNYPRDGVPGNGGVNFPHAYWEGVVARWQGDSTRAQVAFTAARNEVAETVEKQPDFAAALSLLGMIDAGLGRKEDALREGRRACGLLPISKDAIDGVALAVNLAQIYAWTGEKDLAIEQIATVERVPNLLSYGYLKLSPIWDSLRGDPRFEKIVASLAPKAADK